MMSDPLDYRDIQRPRANSWLDKSARRVSEVLAERYGLATSDPDQGYLRQAEELRRRRLALSFQFKISEQAAQRYFDDETLVGIAEGIARTLAAEHPGTDPFSDTDTVLIFVDLWLRGIWGLQLAATATRPENDEYAWSNVRVATGMVAALVKTVDAAIQMQGGVFAAPRAGVVYVARTMTQTAEQIRIWECELGDLTAERLADELDADAGKLRALLER